MPWKKASCIIKLVSTINHTSMGIVAEPVGKLISKQVTELSTCHKQIFISKVVLHTIQHFIIIQHGHELLHLKNIIKLAKSISPKKENARIKSGFQPQYQLILIAFADTIIQLHDHDRVLVSTRTFLYSLHKMVKTWLSSLFYFVLLAPRFFY